MALNIKETLEILERAGLGQDDRMKPSDREQLLDERLRRLQLDPYCEDEFPDYRRYNAAAPADNYRRDTREKDLLELLNIDDL